jgi:hypothetical protein
VRPATPTAADPKRLAAELAGIGPRPPCSDGERRAARVLARRLRALGRRPRTETVWVCPPWPAVWLAHAVAGLAASLASPSAPAVALAVLAAAAGSALAELAGRPALSLAWPRRATQNVVAPDPRPDDGRKRPAVRLVITAAYDAPRRPGALAAPLRRPDAALRRATGGWWPAPLGLLALALLALAACAGARAAGVEAAWLGAAQVVPTLACVVAIAVLAEAAVAPPERGANRTASAPAAALALAAALDREPPRHLAVDVVLAGAGSAMARGMRRHVRALARAGRPEDVAVLHLEPCGAGAPVAWRRDGPLVALALHPQLVAAATAAGFGPHLGRGVTGALVARRAGRPAVAVGRLGADGAAPGALDAAALRDTVARCLALVRRLDAEVGRAAPR